MINFSRISHLILIISLCFFPKTLFASSLEREDQWTNAFRSTINLGAQNRPGGTSSLVGGNLDDLRRAPDHDHDGATLRRGTILATAAQAAALAYKHKIHEPTTGKPTLEDNIVVPRQPVFLSALSEEEGHLRRLDNANNCLNVTEIIGSRVLSNVFLGMGVAGVIIAGGVSQFYDAKIGQILLYIAGSCSTIGTLLKQVTDTKMKLMSEMREKMLTAVATQAAQEIGELQAGHQRTKEKLQAEKKKKTEEYDRLREAYLQELQGRRSGAQSPLAEIFLQQHPAARGGTPDVHLRPKSPNPKKESLTPSDSDSQKLAPKSSKRTKKRSAKRSQLITAVNSTTSNEDSGSESSEDDVDGVKTIGAAATQADESV